MTKRKDFSYNGFSKNSGIYGIKNTVSGKWYIGQTTNLLKRIYGHSSKLINGKHNNAHLQSSFNKYGRDSFEFHVLEECGADMLDIRERAWIVYYKSSDREFGYNKDCGGNLKKVLSEETKRKVAAASKGHKMPEKTRVALYSSNKGRKLSEEYKKQVAEKTRLQHIRQNKVKKEKRKNIIVDIIRNYYLKRLMEYERL